MSTTAVEPVVEPVELAQESRDGFTVELLLADGAELLLAVTADGGTWSRPIGADVALDAFRHPARYGAPLCSCSPCRALQQQGPSSPSSAPEEEELGEEELAV